MINLVPRCGLPRERGARPYDAAAWMLCFVLFAWLRFDQVQRQRPVAGGAGRPALGTAAAFLAVGWVTQLHRGRPPLASLEEMVLLGTVVFGVGAVVTALNMIFLLGAAQRPGGSDLRRRWSWPRGAAPSGGGPEERSDESLPRTGRGPRSCSSAVATPAAS